MSHVFRNDQTLDVVDATPISSQPPLASDQQLALWNPTAVGWWSLVFLPICPWLTYANWKVLGEQRRARRSLCFLFAINALQLFVPATTLRLVPELLMLGSWFAWDGWQQIDHLRAQGITNYQHKGLFKPLLVGNVILLAVYFSVGVLVYGYDAVVGA